MSDIKVKIGNKTFYDFIQIYVRKSIEEITGIAELVTVNIFQQKDKKLDIKLNDSVEIYIKDKIVMKGFLETIKIEYNAVSSFLTLICKDNSANLLSYYDNSKNEWKNSTIANILRDLLGNLRLVIDSKASSKANTIFPTFKVNEGEIILDAIKRLCVENGLLIIEYGDGNLTLTIPGVNGKSKDSISFGRNIEECELCHSNEKRYSEYIVKGTNYIDDFKGLESCLIKENVKDSCISTNKKFVRLNENFLDSGKAKSQVKFLKNYFGANSRIVRYSLINWTQSNGELWRINSTVFVEDKISRIKEEMLIKQVEYIYRETVGEKINLYLVNKNFFTDNDATIKGGFDK